MRLESLLWNLRQAKDHEVGRRYKPDALMTRLVTGTILVLAAIALLASGICAAAGAKVWPFLLVAAAILPVVAWAAEKLLDRWLYGPGMTYYTIEEKTSSKGYWEVLGRYDNGDPVRIP